ncbi:MAG: IPT/TIG domain-containing protein [Planctomycetota bacterium]|nr:IPT/TIG domain-containing protein [Planctomycetota bacterium]
MKRTLLIAALMIAVVPLSACNSKKKSHNRGSSTTSAVTSGGNGNNGGGTIGVQGISSVAPNTGSVLGGTAVTIMGSGFLTGSTVEFGFAQAANVVVVSSTRITCTTPPGSAGLVDVVVVLPTNQTLRLNNGFTYDPNGNGGPMARVADYGDPNGEEQELVELMQRARRNPVAEADRINRTRGTTLDFSIYAVRPPLSHNGFLEEAAKFHGNDMATRGFYGHASPEGKNANGRILDTAYDLNDYFGNNPAINLTENIGKGTGAAPGNSLTNPQDVHDTFMIDLNVAGAKHRQMILGHGQFSRYREVGVAYLHRAPSDYVVQEFAFTKSDRPFLVGVAYNDRSGDSVCRAGEGRPGVTVTLSHASGFSISTQTKSAGGFAFEVFVPGVYTLTIDGRSTNVSIQSDNVKVDLRNGAILAN